MSGRRCAIYTRKSTEDGLEQEFNSLDAQREACAAFITSQRHEGWRALPDLFDDGGFSGGDMQRPAVLRLLAAVRERRIDIIVVYKVDRLTRSLADFARIVSILDEHDVAFVSVTQQFNTTSSMGRLTLNVLLSFAQFEREVTAERIRDKIAASKRKGMWMGGPAPLGYDVVNKKLIANAAEARTVKRLYEMYLELGSVRALQDAASDAGIVSKLRRPRDGAPRGGMPFARGALYRLLSNPIYISRVAHKGETFAGQHAAILEPDLWDAVQQRLEGNAHVRLAAVNVKSRSLLAGLVFDETGDRLIASHAKKAGRRYRYYISERLNRGEAPDQSGWRLAGPMLEATVTRIIATRLADPGTIIRSIGDAGLTPERLDQLVKTIRLLLASVDGPNDAERLGTIQALVARIDLSAASIQLALKRSAFTGDPADAGVIVINQAMTLQRRGVEAKFVLPSRTAAAQPDPTLIHLVARAHHWRDLLAGGAHRSLTDLAAAEGVARSDVSRLLPLAFLAPDIVDAILGGRQPVALTANRLKQALPLPLAWTQQRQVLGFAGTADAHPAIL